MSRDDSHLPTVVLASRNRKKMAEMASLLEPLGVRLIRVAELDGVPEGEETGATFAENAALKASQVARASEHWTVADDSGLAVDALDGAPGVYSARYAGPNATDAGNNAKLLSALDGLPPEQRGAAFVCHLAVADPRGTIRLEVSDRCRGRIIDDELGGHGFGYDPLFLIPEYHRTFGQLGPSAKSILSHRARAFHRLVPQLAALLKNAGDDERGMPL
jgi:XTP/dITP diphosphohydrolase